jgi:hypothetical protein
LNYISPEKYCLDFTYKLEEELMDLAVLKAIKENLYPDASKFRDIEKLTLEFFQTLARTAESYDSGWRL